MRLSSRPIDFVKAAEACGLPGFEIERPKRCTDQLREAPATPGLCLVEALLHRDNIVAVDHTYRF